MSEPSAAPPAPAPPAPAPPAAPPLSQELTAALDLGIRFAGGLLAIAFAVVLALLAAFLMPLRIFDVPAPLGLLVAAGGNVALVAFARYVTGSGLGIVGPCIAWIATMLVLGSRTAEGDLVLTGDWRGIAVLFVGAAALTVAGYLAVAPRRASADRVVARNR